MTLEEEIQTMFDQYPSLFQERRDALNHLFCTIGNGYDWVDGELLPISTKNEKGDTIFCSRKDKHDEWEDNPDFHHVFRGQLDLDGKAVQRITTGEDAELYFSVVKYRLRIGKPAHSWCPLSKRFSYILNYPENIKPDWLVGIEETKQLLAADGIVLEGAGY